MVRISLFYDAMSTGYRRFALAAVVVRGVFACSSGTPAEDGASPGGHGDANDPAAAADRDHSPDGAPSVIPEDAGDAGSQRDSGDGGPSGHTADGGRDLSTSRSDFFGASRCQGSGLAFCEDFESGTIDAAKWTAVGTKPTIAGGQHARGAKALHIAVNGDGASYLTTKKPFPAPKNRYWGRAFVRFEKLPMAPLSYAHWTLAAATGSGVAGEIRVGAQYFSGKNIFGVGTDGPTGDWTLNDEDPKNAVRAVPIAEWLCIEWLHAGDTNETRFYWDAVLHPSLNTTESNHGGNSGTKYTLPTFNAVWIGWQEYQTTNLPFELWIDEVAFDPERIGCVL